VVLPDSDGISRVPPYLGRSSEEPYAFAYRTVTLCGLTFQNNSANVGLVNSGPKLDLQNMTAHYPGNATHPGFNTPPVWAVPLSLTATRRISVVLFSCGY
jgi:hypothetical protein